MVKELSRREEQRGWRKAYLWAIPIAVAVGLVAVVGLPLANYFWTPQPAGMDETAGTGALIGESGKSALEPAVIETKQSATYGTYLVDESGRPLYLFKADKQAQEPGQAESACYDECAKAWPPLLTSDTPRTGGQAQADLVSTVARKDGSRQVAYNGWPLYRYVKDVGPEDVTGQDVDDFGAEWYLVTPSGEEVHADRGGGAS